MGGRGAADSAGGQPDRRLALDHEAGAGLLSTFTGVTIFLALLFLAVHLLIGLYLTSVVTAVTWDAARMAAGERGDEAAAEAHARQLLGGYGDDVRLEWGGSGDALTLTVKLTAPNLLWPALTGAIGVEEISRTVTVRAEQFDAGS